MSGGLHGGGTLEEGFEGRIGFLTAEQEVVNRNHLTRKTFKKCMEER